MKTKLPNRAASTKKRDASKEKIATEQDKFDLKHILVPIDFSVDSRKALRYAAAFARQFDARIILLHVVVPIPVSAEYPYGPAAMQYQDETATRDIEVQLSAFGRKEAGERVSQAVVRCGPAFDEIARAAKELHIDLIVLSTHGYTGLNHILLGSTAERVVRHAPCPVLIVREREREFVRE
jgi:nucleotide-binding universal stress UspA family protein